MATNPWCKSPGCMWQGEHAHFGGGTVMSTGRTLSYGAPALPDYGLRALATAIMLQAAFIMGYTRGRSPGRVRARRELREANERRIAEFDRAKAMMLSYEDLLAAAYRQRNELEEANRILEDRVLRMWADQRDGI